MSDRPEIVKVMKILIAGGHGQLGAETRQAFARAVEPVLKQIAHGGDLDPFGGGDAVLRRARRTPSRRKRSLRTRAARSDRVRTGSYEPGAAPTELGRS